LLCIHNKNYCQILRAIDDPILRHVGHLGILSDHQAHMICMDATLHIDLLTSLMMVGLAPALSRAFSVSMLPSFAEIWSGVLPS
jgi:hypothetical protein